jgi:hypothetical protein
VSARLHAQGCELSERWRRRKARPAARTANASEALQLSDFSLQCLRSIIAFLLAPKREGPVLMRAMRLTFRCSLRSMLAFLQVPTCIMVEACDSPASASAKFRRAAASCAARDDMNGDACPAKGMCTDILGTICWLDLAIFLPEFKICSLTFSAELPVQEEPRNERCGQARLGKMA